MSCIFWCCMSKTGNLLLVICGTNLCSCHYARLVDYFSFQNKPGSMTHRWQKNEEMLIHRSNSLKTLSWKGARAALQQCPSSPASDPATAQHMNKQCSFWIMRVLLQIKYCAGAVILVGHRPSHSFVFIINTNSWSLLNLKVYFPYDKQPLCACFRKDFPLVQGLSKKSFLLEHNSEQPLNFCLKEI